MRLYPILILAAGLLIAADDPKKDPPAKATEGLKGTWSIVAIEAPDGKKAPEEATKDSKLVFTDDTATMHQGESKKEATYKIDGTKSPKTIDITPSDGPEKGKTLLGIYLIEGDTLKICISEPGNPRPKDIKSNEASKSGILTLKRAKP